MTGDTRGGYGGQRGGYRGDYRGGGGGGGYRGGDPRGGGDYRGGGEPRERRGIPLSALDPALTAVSHKVIGCARDVHAAIGPGHPEAVYLEALKHELTAQGVPYKMGYTIPIRYKDHVVGQTTADFLIDDRFILELMAEYREVSGADRSALKAQLKAADVELGLIINFAGRLLKDGLVRVLNVEKINAMRGDLDDDQGYAADAHAGAAEPAEGDHGQTLDFDDRG
ncbi:MAG: GxxExxY protein [Phycisphaeraceae bacterium]|nr:MAG: GxxExxY protein [Phycisphaeraceae bacterium]